jgi:predicted transcriptional regulator
MRLHEVRDILKAEVLLGEDQLDSTIILGGGGADLMEDLLSAVAKGAVLLTGLTTQQVIQTAKVAEVGAVVIVRGKRPSPEFLDMARAFNMPVLRTQYSMFVASGRLYMNGLRGLDGSW